MKAFATTKQWIGIDLDGTLSETSRNSEIGKPIKAMVDVVKKILDDETYSVKIFTARADSEDQINKIKDWLKEHGLPDLEITNVKDKYAILLLDNIAARVRTNTGEICGECLEAINARLGNKFSGGLNAFIKQEIISSF